LLLMLPLLRKTVAVRSSPVTRRGMGCASLSQGAGFCDYNPFSAWLQTWRLRLLFW